MTLDLIDDPDGRVGRAALAATVATGLALAGDGRAEASVWWRAGVAEAIGRTPDGVAPARYDAARSPRSTLGATRA